MRIALKSSKVRSFFTAAKVLQASQRLRPDVLIQPLCLRRIFSTLGARNHRHHLYLKTLQPGRGRKRRVPLDFSLSGGLEAGVDGFGHVVGHAFDMGGVLAEEKLVHGFMEEL